MIKNYILYIHQIESLYIHNPPSPEQETASTWVMTTSSPADVTIRHHNGNSVESCPSTHESYCLYQGVCFYFPEMESYACK